MKFSIIKLLGYVIGIVTGIVGIVFVTFWAALNTDRQHKEEFERRKRENIAYRRYLKSRGIAYRVRKF